MFEVPRLKIRNRSGVYKPGQERVIQILEVALDILIERGYPAVTMREIARRCGVRVGAINHYYKSRDDLLQDLLSGIINSYDVVFHSIRDSSDLSAEDKLNLFISSILDDITTVKTTNLFPELWSVSNHDPVVAKFVDIIYIKSRVVLNGLIQELNPQLDIESRETLALFISASLEGMTVFAGWKKPWSGQMPLLKTIACRSLVSTVKSITNEELKGHRIDGETSLGNWVPPTLLNIADYSALVAGEATPPIKESNT